MRPHLFPCTFHAICLILVVSVRPVCSHKCFFLDVSVCQGFNTLHTHVHPRESMCKCVCLYICVWSSISTHIVLSVSAALPHALLLAGRCDGVSPSWTHSQQCLLICLYSTVCQKTHTVWELASEMLHLCVSWPLCTNKTHNCKQKSHTPPINRKWTWPNSVSLLCTSILLKAFCQEINSHTNPDMLLAIIRVYEVPPGSEGPSGWNLSFSLCLIVFLISFFSPCDPQRLYECHLATLWCQRER